MLPETREIRIPFFFQQKINCASTDLRVSTVLGASQTAPKKKKKTKQKVRKEQRRERRVKSAGTSPEEPAPCGQEIKRKVCQIPRKLSVLERS